MAWRRQRVGRAVASIEVPGGQAGWIDVAGKSGTRGGLRVQASTHGHRPGGRTWKTRIESNASEPTPQSVTPPLCSCTVLCCSSDGDKRWMSVRDKATGAKLERAGTTSIAHGAGVPYLPAASSLRNAIHSSLAYSPDSDSSLPNGNRSSPPGPRALCPIASHLSIGSWPAVGPCRAREPNASSVCGLG